MTMPCKDCIVFIMCKEQMRPYVGVDRKEALFGLVNQLVSKCSLIDRYITNKFYEESDRVGKDKLSLLDFVKTNMEEIFNDPSM